MICLVRKQEGEPDLLRRIYLFVVALTLFFSLAIFGSRVIGASRENPAITLMKSESCTPDSCWHGIQTGVATFTQLRNADSHYHLEIVVGIYGQIQEEYCWELSSDTNWRYCV